MYGFTEESFDRNYAESRNALSASPKTGAIQGPEPQREIGAALQAGQPMVGKIPGIKVYAQPNRSADKLMLLSKSDEVIYMGEERDGLYRVTTQKGEGWVDKLLVKKL